MLRTVKRAPAAGRGAARFRTRGHLLQHLMEMDACMRGEFGNLGDDLCAKHGGLRGNLDKLLEHLEEIDAQMRCGF